jgi:translation initiation factor IF-3
MKEQKLYNEETPRPVKEKKPQKKHKLHDIRLHTNIGDNDLKVKLKQVESFLSKKDQVRITVQLRGREKSRPQSGLDFINKIIEQLEHIGKPQTMPTTVNLSVVLNPKK